MCLQWVLLLVAVQAEVIACKYMQVQFFLCVFMSMNASAWGNVETLLWVMWKHYSELISPSCCALFNGGGGWHTSQAKIRCSYVQVQCFFEHVCVYERKCVRSYTYSELTSPSCCVLFNGGGSWHTSHAKIRRSALAHERTFPWQRRHCDLNWQWKLIKKNWN